VEKLEDAIEEVGAAQVALYARSEIQAAAKKNHFGIQVHWHVGDAKWNYTPGDVKRQPPSCGTASTNILIQNTRIY